MNGSARSGPRQARFIPAVPLAAGGGGLAGLCLGFGLRQVVDAPPGEMAGPLAIAGGIALAIAAFVVLRARRHDGASGLTKDVGTAASTRHAVEHALAAPDCAVAHSVSTIARAGHIDHLVATPVRLWVIGTVGEVPLPMPRDNKLRNFPERGGHDWSIGSWTGPQHPSQFYLVQE